MSGSRHSQYEYTLYSTSYANPAEVSEISCLSKVTRQQEKVPLVVGVMGQPGQHRRSIASP